MSETIKEKTGNINDILKIVNRANETFAYEIFIPSLKKNVMFREINTSQQKRLVKAIIDNPAFNTEFIFALKKIIDENCVEDINIDNLTIYDKMIIAMHMRSISIDNNYDLKFTVAQTETTKEQTIVRRISLQDLIKIAVDSIKIEPTIIKDDKNIFEIFCYLPTIQDEFQLESELRKNIETKLNIKDMVELRETIGEVFTNEIVKYIRQVNIKNAETNEVTEIKFTGMSFKDRLNILGIIPAKINNKIVEYINTISKEFEKVLLFKETIDGKTIEQRLKIDSSFFTVS